MAKWTEVGHVTWKPEKQRVSTTRSMVQNDAEKSRKLQRTNLYLAPAGSDSGETEKHAQLYRTENFC